jgi:hypothetical protein
MPKSVGHPSKKLLISRFSVRVRGGSLKAEFSSQNRGANTQLHTDQSATNQLILKNCRTCGAAKPLDEFYRHPSSASRRQASCKACQKRRAAEWQQAHKGRHRDSVAAWKATHPEQVRRYEAAGRVRQDEAHQAFVRTVVSVASTVRRAIKSGVLVPPDQCGGCARPSVRLDAVHEDYSRPLDITWLCRRCHYHWSLARRQAGDTTP